jgi:uncharacterized phage protein gp47/JayE
MAEKLPQVKSYPVLLSEILATFQSKIGVNDNITGSVNLSFFETVAQAIYRSTGDVLSVLRDLSVDRARGNALDKLAAEEGLVRFTSTVSTGTVTVRDTSFDKISTKIYAGSASPNIGSLTIDVSDASSFPLSGSLYIGRGTPNIEGPLPYSSITPIGGFYRITLTSPTTKFHNISESIILAQGGTRSIPANTVVKAPSSGASADINFSVNRTYIMLDGENIISGIAVTAQQPGLDGNVPQGAIKEFSSDPFSGAEVINDSRFTTGKATETDEELRNRIKAERQSKGLGTDLAIKNKTLGATAPDESATVISNQVVKTSNGTVLYIDDGSGYEAKTLGVGLESIIDSAIGGERFFQLKTGGRQTSIAKAFLESSIQSPFSIVGGDSLSIIVGGTISQHIFNNSDFKNSGTATVFEIVSSINGNPNLLFSASTSDNNTRVVLFAKAEVDEYLQLGTATQGNDVGQILGFASNEVQTVRLYKNNIPLFKNGRNAIIDSASQTLWSASIQDGDTLIISVDSTDSHTYTFNNADFIAQGSFLTVSPSNSLQSWVDVINTKITGITASVNGDKIRIISNLGKDVRSKIEIDPSSTLVGKGMFSSVSGLTASGTTSGFKMSRNTAQIELPIALSQGDSLTVGTQFSKGEISSSSILGSSVSLSSDANLWILMDTPSAEIIRTGVVGSTTITVSKQGSNTIRFTSSSSSAFSDVLPGDYLIIWGTEFNSSLSPLHSDHRGEWRVKTVTNSYVEVVVTSSEYIATSVSLTPITITTSGFVVIRTENAVQKITIPAGVYNINTAASLLADSLVGGTYRVENDEFIILSTTTDNDTGSILMVTFDTAAGIFGFSKGAFGQSSDSFVASYISQSNDKEFPLFLHGTFAQDRVASPPSSHVSDLVSTESLGSVFDPNFVTNMLNPYPSFSDNVSKNESALINIFTSPTAFTITQEEFIKRARIGDRYFISNPFDFGSDDTVTVVLDNDPTNKTFSIPLYRKATTNTSKPVSTTDFNAYDIQSGSNIEFYEFFGQSFDMSNFKVLMRAKNVLHPTNPLVNNDALLFRSVLWGRSGEKYNIGYTYPAAANQPISSSVTVDDIASIRISLKSGSSVVTNHSGTTAWNISIVNMGAYDEVTYAISSGPGDLSTLNSGNYVNIKTSSGLNPSNTGVFKILSSTSTQFVVKQKAGIAIAETGALTLVSSSISFYENSDTLASEIQTYVNASLSDYLECTIVQDIGTDGSGIIGNSTYEDSDFSYSGIGLVDGINWIKENDFQNPVLTQQFRFKVPLTLSYFDTQTPDAYAFNNGEEIRLIPISTEQVVRFLNVLAVSGFSTLGTISSANRETKVQFSTLSLGSIGAIRVVGGSANASTVPLRGSSIKLTNDQSKIKTSIDASSLIGFRSDQWVKLQAQNFQNKQTDLRSTNTVKVIPNYPSLSKSSIFIESRDADQRIFGLPRHYTRTSSKDFVVEKHGKLVCISVSDGSNPNFSKSLAFNDSSSSTYTISFDSLTNRATYVIESGNLTFSELTKGDFVTISNTSNSSNSGTFEVIGVSDNGKELVVLNPNAVNELASGSILITDPGASTPALASITLYDFAGLTGDIAIVNGVAFTEGVNWTKGASLNEAATNLAAAITASLDLALTDIGASSTGNIVNLFAITAGTAGNSYTLAYTDVPQPSNSITTSGSNFTGGTISTAATAYAILTDFAGLTGDILNVNGVTFTEGVDWSKGFSLSQAATNLAAAITASANPLLSNISATSSSNTVNLTADTVGVIGNTYTLSYTDVPQSSPSMTISGATFSGGTDSLLSGDSFTIGTTTLVEGVDFIVGVNSSATASNLAAAINSITNISASSNGSTVNISSEIHNYNPITTYSDGGSSGAVVNQAQLVSSTANTGDFSSTSSISEGDTAFIGSPFNILNRGKFRVIRKYLNSFYIDNPIAVEEKVSTSTSIINLGQSGTTEYSLSVNGESKIEWTGAGSEPDFSLAQVGDEIILSTPEFSANNAGTFMVTESALKQQTIFRITLPIASSITASKYWTFELPEGGYYVWYKVNGIGTDPALVGKTGILVNILSTDSAATVAQNTYAQLTTVLDLTAAINVDLIEITANTAAFTADPTVGNMPVSFLLEIIQIGTRSFVKYINPLATNDVSNVGGLIINRPSIVFYEYEATVQGDKINVTGDLFGSTFNGVYTVNRTLSKTTALVDGIINRIQPVLLGSDFDNLLVEEGVAYDGYKQINYLVSNPSNPELSNIIFNSNAQFEKITENAGLLMSSESKLDFPTKIKRGLDAYRYHTGLIAEVNRIVYGDPRDSATYSGVAAAGAEIFINEPLFKRIQVSLNIRINTGIPFAQIAEQVRSTVSSLVKSNNIGESIALSSIISAAASIPGIVAVTATSPQIDSVGDLISVGPGEKTIIIDDISDILIAKVG